MDREDTRGTQSVKDRDTLYRLIVRYAWGMNLEMYTSRALCRY